MMAIVLSGLVLVCSTTVFSATVSEDDVVLARVGTETVTAADVRQKASARLWYRSDPTLDRERVETLVDDAIAELLIFREAESRSYIETIEARNQFDKSMSAAAQRMFNAEFIRPNLQVDSFTIDTFYHHHISRYSTTRDQRRVRHITIAKPGRGVPEHYSSYRDPVYEGWDPKRKIDSIYIRLFAGEDFTRLAKAHTEEPHSKGMSGDIGWVSEKSLTEGAFRDSCLAMPLNKISRPFEGANAWHILQVTELRPAGPVPLNSKIALDIGKILSKDQSRVLRRTIKDSIVESGALRFIDRFIDLPADDMSPSMPLAVANDIDTIFAVKFLMRRRQVESENGGPLNPEQMREMLRTSFYITACWWKYYRDLGYWDRPEIRESRQNEIRRYVLNQVRVEIKAPATPPDSATINQYYQTHPGEFATPKRSLVQAWTAIRLRIMNERSENQRRARLDKLAGRYGVTRYSERIATVTLADRPRRPR